MMESLQQAAQIATGASHSLNIGLLSGVGLNLVGGLSAIVLSWFGIQGMLAGGNFSDIMSQMIRTVFLISITYWLVSPGFGEVWTAGVDGSLSMVADLILPGAGAGSVLQMASGQLWDVNAAVAANLSKMFENVSLFDTMTVFFKNLPTIAILLAVEGIVLIALFLMFAIASVGMALVQIALLLGPIFIPWLIIDKTSFLFWGWVKFLVSSCLYKVVGAAVILYANTVITSGAGLIAQARGEQPESLMAAVALGGICLTIVYLVIQIPALANGLVSGSSQVSLPSLPRRAGSEPRSKADKK